MVAFLPIAMIGPFFYALENTYVAERGTAGMDALQAMLGSSIAGRDLLHPPYAGNGSLVSRCPCRPALPNGR